MPTYEYRCRDCGRHFDVFQRMSDPARASCPDCGRGAKRLISGGAGFLFKGDGFYITDHRSEDYRKRAREESGGGDGRKTAEKPVQRGAKSSSGEDGGSTRTRKRSGGREARDAAAAGSSSGSGDGASGKTGA